MNNINRALLNLLCIGVFASSFFVLGLFNTGSKLADIYNNQPKEEEVVKTEGEPFERQIMRKNDDGEFLQFILWDSKTQSEHTIRVNPSDYDLYKIGEQYYSNTDTQPDYD